MYKTINVSLPQLTLPTRFTADTFEVSVLQPVLDKVLQATLSGLAVEKLAKTDKDKLIEDLKNFLIFDVTYANPKVSPTGNLTLSIKSTTTGLLTRLFYGKDQVFIRFNQPVTLVYTTNLSECSENPKQLDNLKQLLMCLANGSYVTVCNANTIERIITRIREMATIAV